MTDYQIAIEGMTKLLDDPQFLIDSFKRASYEGAFQRFYLKQVPTFDAIERLHGSVVDKETMTANMAAAFVDAVKAMDENEPKRTRETARINRSLVMAGYVYPAILQYGGESSPLLIRMVQEKWKEAFPKSNITPAGYDEIEKGFHRKWCYITTAACQYRGMDDDCEELNLLRAYRDGYMMSQPSGAQLIRDYYDIAPSIVKHIGKREDAKEIYDDVWERFIGPCIEDIRQGRLDACLSTYTEMVLDMKEKYFHLYPHVKSGNDQ